MQLLNKQQILGAEDRGGKTVEVPEWGGAVRLTELTAADFNDLASFAQRNPEKSGAETRYRERFLARCIVDEHGTRLFTDEDIETLSGKCGRVVQRLFVEAQKVNALDAAAIGDAEKNSATSPGAASSSN